MDRDPDFLQGGYSGVDLREDPHVPAGGVEGQRSAGGGFRREGLTLGSRVEGGAGDEPKVNQFGELLDV